MVDWVALTSVTSSGLVAVGGLVLTYRSGREQRAHELRLSFEERAWEQKSAGLFEVIAAAQVIVSAQHDEEKLAMTPWTVGPRLDAQVGVVEVYGSDECRWHYQNLVRPLVKAYGEWFDLYHEIEECREIKTEAIDARDFDRAARARHDEKEALKKILEASGDGEAFIDLPSLAEHLVTAARECLQGQPDKFPFRPKDRPR